MIAIETLLNIICTEAFEHDGILEVPDHKHGAVENYSSPKRQARGVVEDGLRQSGLQRPALQYDLELLRRPDGSLDWVE